MTLEDLAPVQEPLPAETCARTAARTGPLPTADVGGVNITAATEEQVVEHILGQIRAGKGGRIATINLDILRQLCTDRVQMSLLDGVDVCVPDGMPLLWAARIRGQRLPERVTGADLVWSLSAAAAQSGLRVFFLGAPEGVADRAATKIAASAAGLQIAGTYAPPFGYDEDEDEIERIHAKLLAARPDLVFCAFGFPKQEALMERLCAGLPCAWFLACGGAFSMAAGDIKRAPRWAQRSGLEWIFRLAREPLRLAERYLVRDIPFGIRLISVSLLRNR